MEYITRQPRTLTATESRLLRTIAAAGYWLPEPKCQTFDEQEALHFLWKSGYIEMASFGGWKPKAGQVKPALSADTVRALLAAHGIIPTREIVECKDARRRSQGGTSWLVILPAGARIPADVWARFEKNAYRDGNILIVELKG